jgi:hypothetical protein
LRQIARLQDGVEKARAAVEDAEALAAQCAQEPEVQAARDWLEGVPSKVAGRVEAAERAEDVVAALRRVLAEVRAHVEDNELEVRVRLRADELPGYELPGYEHLIVADADKPARVVRDRAELDGLTFD